jgi:ubiquinone biosynthesis protein
MLRSARNLLRLLVIARTLARHDALAPLQEVLPEGTPAAAMLVVGRLIARPRPAAAALRPGERLAAALGELGPAFIKLGQMLSTRSDMLGEQMAADLSRLQDRLPPFPAAEARATIAAELGRPVAELFDSFDDRPVSAASIAQVHFATIAAEAGADPGNTEVAVKVLRPGIERAFARDLELMLWLAELIERAQPKLRRLRPVKVVQTFAATVRIEMDLRLEAAAASELAANFVGDPTYRVPAVDWRRTGQRVLTQERLAGIRMDDRAALVAAGHDVDQVLARAAAIFFKQVFRDGYFHGDQHPGNMIVDADSNIGAVDFGIMGRLDRKTRYYLADMLLAFLVRDYRRVAELHIVLGYVPAGQSVEEFAQACRAIGEPIFGRPLADISFARVLGQLFRLAETFDMEVQPQLLLLQKNMLMAEGVSRQLNPALNIWTLAQPLIEQWMRDNRGPEARIGEALGGLARGIERLPAFLADLEKAAAALARDGIGRESEASRQPDRGHQRYPLWPVWLAIAALALLVLLR